jgi:hypothetical protein
MPKESQRTALPVDPVFAAIDAHVAVVVEVERKVALDDPGANCGNMFECAKVVVNTAPTTSAGLQALAAHVRQYFAYGSGDALCIVRPLPGGGMHGGGVGAAEWLIAKRAAELAA